MPREFVVGSEFIRLEPLTEQEAEAGSPLQVVAMQDGQAMRVAEEGLVSVGWHRDLESVQVTTLTRDPASKETRQEGPYIDLDRRGINDLIRQLRRARDQAYGRDE